MSFPGLSSLSTHRNNPLLTLPIPSKAWGEDVIFDWYNHLHGNNPAATAINKLQIRKDTSGVHHRFLLLYMQDKTIHRLDRHPDRFNEEDPARNIDVLKNRPVQTKDELICDLAADQESLTRALQTNNEIELCLDGKIDLKVVLSACFAISKDRDAKMYTLFAHNCFFFSWTILMVVSRCCLPYVIPLREQLLKRANHYIHQLTNTIVDEAVTLFLDLVVETVTIFRNKAQTIENIYKGMHPMVNLAWSLPTGVLQTSWRQMFSARLHFGLKTQLKQHISEVLKKRAIELCTNVLQRHNMPFLMDRHLWLKELHKIVGPAVQAEVINILWGAIFDAISGGFGEVDESMLADDPNLRFSFLGKRAAQFYAVWNAALHGGLKKAREVAEEVEEEVRKSREEEIAQIWKESDGNRDILAGKMSSYESVSRVHNEKMFNLAWDAAQQGALESAKAVAEATRDQMKQKDIRDCMWKEIWNVWPACWDEARRTACKKSIDTIDRIALKLLETVMEVVIDELGDSKSYIMAKIQVSDSYGAPVELAKIVVPAFFRDKNDEQISRIIYARYDEERYTT
ncbi:hypothetical protein VKT23_019331 [Stygiomarasmius scandens]|uniref:Uncharacterized protein n=1 Tax=Marasmiellus scandens TaxID=2682957 RepID=A0ABR1IN64_9AGAR